MPKLLRMFAWTHAIVGGIGLGLFLLTLGIALSARDPAYEDEIALLIGLFGMVAVVFFAPSFLGGIGLLKGVSWARSLMWIQAGLLALVVPIGTVIAGINLWVLVTTREISADGGIAKFEVFIHRSIRGFVLALIALFILGVIIGLGYLFRDVIDPPREQILTPLPSGVPTISDVPRFEYEPPTSSPREPAR
ncbi:MAG TPA: hypothetical protein PLN33_01885 [Hyphomonadaceae bacterium]|nr:hypothetical protein [Hyphomonadaceae bacterium]HPN04546.1 hypothetical protein [Hyphomonadaceae bacterium]